MLLLHFVDQTGEPLFSSMAEVVPRIGERVTHIVEPTNPNEWEPGALQHQLTMSRRAFRVVRIDHELRKTSVMRPESQAIFLTVEPADPH